MKQTTTREGKVQTKREIQDWVARQNAGRALMDQLHAADENGDDVTPIIEQLEGMGYIVEWTSSGYMVSR